MTVLVVSDLDGSLLDHDSYSFAAAKPALQRLRDANIPVVLNTSKTAAETRQWTRRLDLDTPFVVENGGAVHGADGTLLQALGRPRNEILAWLRTMRGAHGWRWTSFADMPPEALRQHTGLDAAEAAMAADRHWSEPLLWQDTPDNLHALQQRAESNGLSLLQGGRFWSLQGQHDKGSALPAVKACLRLPDDSRVLALGDGQNDRAMLAAADVAVWIRSPAHPPPQLNRHSRQIISRRAGPAGWNDTVLHMFEEGFFANG